MANSSNGELVKLTIKPCKRSDDSVSVLGEPAAFSAMLNPTSWKHALAITHHTSKGSGKISEIPRFNRYGANSVSFSLLLDGTGVVDKPQGASNSVSDQIEHLKSVVYDYDNQTHEPRISRIVWGKFSYDGHLESMNLDYTLFKPSGEPLRAKVDLKFIQALSSKAESLLANRASPDLTHRIVFKAGDSLPLLCMNIYGDVAYYPAVARYNRIVNFRAIAPGTTLFFPPLR